MLDVVRVFLPWREWTGSTGRQNGEVFKSGRYRLSRPPRVPVLRMTVVKRQYRANTEHWLWRTAVVESTVPSNASELCRVMVKQLTTDPRHQSAAIPHCRAFMQPARECMTHTLQFGRETKCAHWWRAVGSGPRVCDVQRGWSGRGRRLSLL